MVKILIVSQKFIVKLPFNSKVITTAADIFCVIEKVNY